MSPAPSGRGRGKASRAPAKKGGVLGALGKAAVKAIGGGEKAPASGEKKKEKPAEKKPAEKKK